MPNDQACSDVIGFGRVEELVDRERKCHALNWVMRHYDAYQKSFTRVPRDLQGKTEGVG